MAFPARFQDTLNLIKAVRSLGHTGCSVNCGHTASAIHAEYNALFPDAPLTLEQVTELLEYQAGKGVFRKSGFAQDGGFYWVVNPEMNQVNPSNQHFVNSGLTVDTTQPGPGYLPCGYSADFQRDPYSGAVNVGSVVNNSVYGGVSGNVGGSFC